MQEYHDGTFGEPKSLDEALKERTDKNVKATHFGTESMLHALKKSLQEGKTSNEDFKLKQLDRIEAMLGCIILHFQIPYDGIITIKKPTTGV